MSRPSRIARLIVLVSLVGVVAVACGDDDEATGTDPTEPAGGADASPPGGGGTTDATVSGGATGCTPEREGGEATMASFTFTVGLDPASNSASGPTGGTELTAIYDTLMRWDWERHEFVPHLAQSLVGNRDSTVWTLSLRPGITFGNGDALDADAVVASMSRLGPRSFQQGYLNGFITEMTTLDDLTVRFTLSEPWGFFPYHLARGAGMIVNTAVVDSPATGPSFAANEEVGAGAGPYRIVRYAPNEEIVLEAKDDYWGGPVCIQTLRFVSIPSSRATFEAFDLGEVDVAYLREPQVVADAVAAGTNGHVFEPGFSNVLFVNNRDGHPGHDLSVRQAIVHALDVDVINDRANGGAGHPTTALVPTTSGLWSGVDGPSHDPELARTLVEEARSGGWDGRIGLLCSTTPYETELSIAVEAQLEAVGFEVDIELIPPGDKTARVSAEHNFDVACYGNSFDDTSAWAAIRAQLSSTSEYSATGYGDRGMDEAIALLGRATSIEESRDAIALIQERWNETAPSAMYDSLQEFIVWDDDVHGIVPSTSAYVMFHQAYVAG